MNPITCPGAFRTGFIFSIDSFVAFSLSLVAIYSMLFFSSIPSAYYSSLMQAHYLAKDTLTALSLSNSSEDGVSELGYLLFVVSKPAQSAVIEERIGPLIPNQFGYLVETSEDGEEWDVVYDTKDNPSDSHNKAYNKLRASAGTLIFGYASSPKTPQSPYRYITCNGPYTHCGPASRPYPRATGSMKLVRLVVYV